MKVENLQEAIKDLLVNQASMSVYEFGAYAEISPLTLDRHIKGNTKRIQEGTLRKIRENTIWDFHVDGDKITFFKKSTKENQENADRNSNVGEGFVCVEVSEKDKEWLDIIKDLDEEQREALKTILKA